MRVGVCVLLCVWAATAAAQGVESGKVFVSEDGVAVEVVQLKGQPKAIVRVTGSGTELDGKARLHEIVDNGSRVEYRGKWRGGDFYTFNVEKGGHYVIYLPRRSGELRVKFSEEKTKALKPDTVWAAHQQQMKDGTLPALERFDRKARVSELEKQLAEEAASAEKACGVKFPVAVEWNALTDETLLKYSVSSFCGNPLGELRDLCGSGEGKAWVIDNVKRLSCKLASSGPTMSLEVKDGTLLWSTSTEAYNQEEFARKQLLGAPAAAGEPPWGKAETLAQRLAMEKTAVCSDGKSHVVIAAPHPQNSTQLYWGDGKSFVEVLPPGPHMSGDMFYDPRHVNPSANPNFRGYDIRVHSSVDVSLPKQTCAARCGERKIALKLLPPSEARPILMAAKIGPSPQKWRPHVLFRDEKGLYYYVDRGLKVGEEKRFRLFKGIKGSMKEQKMTNVVSDSEGEIFSTKTGSLRMIIDRKQPSLWVEGKKSTKLREVPVLENLPMIYSELGVYLGEKLGTPCDDL